MFLLGRRLLAGPRGAAVGATVGLLGTAMVAINLLSSPSGVAACSAAQPPAVAADGKVATSVYDFTANDIDGNPVQLGKYRGHVLIIVNVASKCGYTEGHYKEFNQLYQEYAESKGLRILAFPCNQFGGQEPGSNAEIKEFAKERGVKFDMMAKVKVNGDDTHPLWQYLKQRQGGTLVDAIKWNFTKFIVDKNGQPVGRYGPTTSPLEMREELEKYLNQ
ncbi:glutathione peroxidase-like [Anopheles stephensi]|uniref:glutathione peroxidase-like n=1 Tax=Anopheles stephensi TaxID=30069 RepID=UPI001658C3D7|nr:glutathione peroxidase-like [Anopheles stephensi]XP_035919425.1 glutathione peroxidase-like [Anopheles stephensi]XP_035919426.1 glutathione peroxidase-like [Anopheles stephensi]XP_035919427.1 glutathione peroxidase-like [Anopheles stephensi]